MQKKESFVENFENGALSDDWLTLRDGLGENLVVEEGKMTLTGREKELSELGTPAFLRVRQAEIEEELCVELSKESDPGDGYFGLAVIINVDHYAELTITKAGEGYEVHRIQKIADVEIDRCVGQLNQMPEELKLVNTGAKKCFQATAGEQTVSFEMDAINLSNEALAALNTGDIEGIHAYGDSKMVVTKVTRQP